MQITSVRLGHVCNSSSAHSIVFYPGLQDVDPEWEGSFGWDYFTAASRASKMHYLAGTLAGEFGPLLGGLIAQALLGIPYSVEYSVDHQSRLPIPRDWSDSNAPDMEFVEALRTFLATDGVAILGGNDNDELVHPAMHQATKIYTLPTDLERKLVCRHEGGHAWTLFNRSTGGTVQFNFGDPVEPKYPEILDVKITNQCTADCAYCYQNSTPDGAIGDLTYKLTDWCVSHRIFAVALGGGEPTSHPQFVRILQGLYYSHVIPNFSTRSLAWIEDDEIWEMVGAVAFSVDQNNVDSTVQALQKLKSRAGKIVLQVIPAVSLPLLKPLNQICGDNDWRMTLLGYKNIGRATAPPYDEKLWSYEISGRYCQIGIDTTLASRSTKDLQWRVPKMLYDVVDGKRSLYVDLVTQQMALSSYEPNTAVPIPQTNEGYDEAFEQLRGGS